MSAPTAGSLFSGCGLMDLGLERAGLEIAFQVEINDYCRRVLDRHWPDVPRFADVRKVTGEQLGYCDLLAGGFPCQDLSHAGRRIGLQGERSGLWREFARLVGEIRPRFVLVENVPGIFTVGGGRAFGTVLADLAAIGYDAEWDCLPAAAFGAPHLRDRVFLVAYPDREHMHLSTRWLRQPNEAPHAAGNGVTRIAADAESLGRPLRSAPRQRVGRPPGGSAAPICDAASFRCDARALVFPAASLEYPAALRTDRWEAESGICGVDDGSADRVDRLAALGGAVLPQIAEWIGRRILLHLGGG